MIAASYGQVVGWPSPSLPLLKSQDTAIGEIISDEQESWLGSSVHLAALCSSPLYSYLNQNVGRKASGYCTAVPLIIGWILIMFADSIIYLYIGRVILGATFTGTAILFTTYIGEISEDSIRGALGSLRGVGADVGILFAYCVGPFLTVQLMGVACVILPAVFLISFYWLPESPMYLLGKGEDKEALKSYLWLRGGDVNIAEEEMKKLSVVIKDSTAEVTLKELLSVRGTRKALIITVVCTAVIPFSGMNVVFTYCERFFQMSGSSLSPEISSIIVSIVNLLGSIVAVICADLTGRRLLLIVTLLLQFVCLMSMGVYLYVKDSGIDVNIVGILPVIFLSLYCFCVVAGVGTIGPVILSEIFRPEARGVAMTICNALTWTFTFITVKFHHSLENLINLYGCFWFYAAVSLAGAIFSYFMIPETKNRSLESILQELNNG